MNEGEDTQVLTDRSIDTIATQTSRAKAGTSKAASRRLRKHKRSITRNSRKRNRR